jgi:hypothetical protein
VALKFLAFSKCKPQEVGGTALICGDFGDFSRFAVGGSGTSDVSAAAPGPSCGDFLNHLNLHV